jgi:hypothetical protein
VAALTGRSDAAASLPATDSVPLDPWRRRAHVSGPRRHIYRRDILTAATSTVADIYRGDIYRGDIHRADIYRRDIHRGDIDRGNILPRQHRP